MQPDAHTVQRLNPSPWTPLRYRPFREVWLAWLVVMVTFWTNELSAAWTMATLADDPLWIALVPAAGSLPIFIFATPAGALADIVDRKNLVTAAQVLAVLASLMLGTLMYFNLMPPALLLAILLLHGSSFAFRLPSFAAAVSDSAPIHEVPKAIALNTMATNMARVIGPLLAGVALTVAQPAWIFIANAALGLYVLRAVRRWPRRPSSSALPSERLVGAIRLGFRFVRATPAVLISLNKGALFFFFSIVTLALLPVLVKTRFAGGSGMYTGLMASFGFGAVVLAILLPRFRGRWTANQLWLGASILNVAACAVLAATANQWVAAAACVAAGASWLCVASSLQIAAQSALPRWVRARAIAVFQMAIMGASAFGALLWGGLASRYGVQASLFCASALGAIFTLMTLHYLIVEADSKDAEPTPFDLGAELSVPVEPDRGPVVIAIRYRVRLEQHAEFRGLMRESRSSRLRNGAISWGLLRDAADPQAFIEHFVFESWADRLRQIDHVTQADELLRRRKREFHADAAPPQINRWISEPE